MIGAFHTAELMMTPGGGDPLTETGWTVIFRKDAAGTPGTIISSQFVPVGTATYTYAFYRASTDNDYFEVSIPLPIPELLAPGTYWVEFQDDSDPVNVFHSMYNSAGPLIGSESWGNDGATLTPASTFFGIARDMVFSLCYDTENCETVSVTNDYNKHIRCK